jgi:signal transduction histidine kinase
MKTGPPSIAQALSAAELDGLLEGLEDAVILLERDPAEGTRVAEAWISGANPALERMIGRPAAEIVGRSLSELIVTPEGAPARVLEGPLRLRDVRGDLRPVAVAALAPRLLLVRDLERERRLEREVWRLSAAREGSGDRPRLLGTELLGTELLGMVEHEMRTAATVIRGYTRMLLEERSGPLNDEQRRYLAESGRATERISRLLDDLLELEALERPAALRVVRKPIRLHDVARAAEREAIPLLAAREQRLEMSLAADCDAVQGDPAQLQQVVVNLIANAAKFAPAGSVVSIDTQVEEHPGGDRFALAIADLGPGVDPAEAESIFEAFARGRAAAEGQAAGVGLGLALCRKILDAHGGEIHAVPRRPGGLFRLSIPLDPVAVATGPED